MHTPLNANGQAWALAADGFLDALQTPGLEPETRKALSAGYLEAVRAVGRCPRPTLMLVTDPPRDRQAVA